MTSKTLVIISDYGTGDPAFTEVMLQLRRFLPGVFIIPQATPAFSTVNTGFWIYQTALTPNLSNTFIFSNTAPRISDKKAQKDNSGEKLMYAKLNNGFEIIGVNAGYNFSFIKPYIQEFNFVNVLNKGSQFRSRDFYPEKVAQMVQKNKSFLGEKTDISIVPDAPKSVIASIDGYGNIKTTIRKSQFNHELGSKLVVYINFTQHMAIYTDAMFNVEEGGVALALGSSGHDDRFLEIIVRKGSAKKLFRYPNVEDKITILNNK